MFGADRREHFEDVGRLLDDGIAALRGKQFCEFVMQLGSRATRYSARVRVMTRGTRPVPRMMAGILSRTSLPTMSVPLAIMRWCSSTAWC